MGLRFISEEDKVADEFLLTESSILQESLQKNITRDSNMAGEQPRQPRDLQGLLKFRMEATASEDAPAVVGDPAARLAAMDPERKAWLEEALDNMSVDVVEQLGNGIKLLLDSSADLETKEEVLDCLEAPHELSHEHVLRAMLSLVQGSTVARKEAQSVQGLLSRLEERLKEVKGRDEGEETEDYCRQLLKELRLEEGVDR